MSIREVSAARTLADVSAEAVVIMAGIVRRHERMQAPDLSYPAWRVIDREIAEMKAQLFELEMCRRGETRA